MVCFVNVHPWRVACNSGKPCLRWLWSQRRCVHVCICACYRVDEIGSTCCFNSFLLKKHLKLFIYFVFIFFFRLTKRFQGLHESLTIQFWIAPLNLRPSQTFIFQVFMILCEISFIYVMLQQQGIEIVLWIRLLSEMSYTWRCKGRRTIGVSFKAIFNLPFQKERRAF